MKSALLLAAGEGKGAWPFCGIRQKCTVPIVNVPMVRRMVLDLLALDVTEIVVVLGSRGEAVRSCLADLAGVRFVEQRTLKGPADAALCGIDAVTGPDTLVCYGDIVTTRDTLRGFLDAYRTRKAHAMLLTTACPVEVPHWITVHAAEDGLVQDVIGHGDRAQPRFAGIAAARTETLKTYLLRNPGLFTDVEIGAMPPPEGDVAHSFGLMTQDGIEVHAYAAPDFVVDVDRAWQIAQANMEAARHATEAIQSTVLGEGARIDDGAEIAEGARLILGPGARIGKGCHIGGSMILGKNTQVLNGALVGAGVCVGNDTQIRDYCSVNDYAVIGSKSLVKHDAEFGGVMFDVVYLYHYCCITALLGNNVDIGAATVCGTLRFDNGIKTQINKGHKEVPDARYGDLTIIGDYSRTGVNVMFMPGVKVGYYSCVGAGAIVYEDVPERTLLLPKQEHILKPWGPERYGW
ncbi:MAG: NTP transferase domain-containing protein [Candidatus Hydrogenedentales bacterium]|jgi:NDP-sugar pyrophosphorylase family protein